MPNNKIINASLVHTPVALVVDRSISISSVKEEMNQSLDVFLTVIHSFKEIAGVLDLALYEYSDEVVRKQPFYAVTNSTDKWHIEPGGCTRADLALKQVFDDMQYYKHEVLKRQDVSYNRGLVFHITDGQSQGDIEDLARCAQKLEENKSLVLYTIATPGADLDQIRRYTSTERIIDLTGCDIGESLPGILAAVAVLSASSAGSGSGSTQVAAAVNNEAAAKAASLLADFGLADK